MQTALRLQTTVLAGQWIEPSHNHRLTSNDPGNFTRVIGHVPMGNAQQANQAVEHAARCFPSGVNARHSISV